MSPIAAMLGIVVIILSLLLDDKREAEIVRINRESNDSRTFPKRVRRISSREYGFTNTSGLDSYTGPVQEEKNLTTYQILSDEYSCTYIISAETLLDAQRGLLQRDGVLLDLTQVTVKIL